MTPKPDISPENVARMLDGVTPGPWFVQDFTAPQINDNPGAWDVHVSCDWPNHLPVASMGGGFEGNKALWQARNDARFIAYAREALPTLAARVAELEARLCSKDVTIFALNKELEVVQARAALERDKT